MEDTTPFSLSRQIMAAQNYARTAQQTNVRAHYIWTVEQITTSVSLADLTTDELIALTALLIPAHSRVLDGAKARTPVPLLRLIRRNEG